MSQDPPTDHRTSPYDRGRSSRRRVVAVVVVIGLCLSLLAAERWTRTEQRQERERFHSLTYLRQSYVESTLTRYGDLLANLAAFEATSHGSAEDYAQFVASQRLDWLVGIDNTAFVTRLGSRTQVRYTAPHPPRTPPGHNLSEHPRRRNALTSSVDTGTPAIGPVGEIAIPEGEEGAGARLIEMFMAVYEPGPPPATVEERRERHIGWVAVTADLDKMVRELAVEDRDLDMAVQFGDTGELLGENTPGARERIRSAGLSAEVPIALSNRPLTLRTAYSPDHEEPRGGLLLFGIGTVMTLLASYAVGVTHRHRSVLLETADFEHRRADLMSSRFHSAVTEAPVGVLVTDNEGHVVLINGRLRHLLGAPADGASSIFDYIHPDDQGFILDGFRSLTEGRTDHLETERELLRPDGSSVWCRISASTIRDQDGLPAGIVAHVQDVTAERQAEEERRSRERWFSSIVEHARDLIVLIDSDGTVKWASPWVGQLLGVEADDLVGTSVLDTIDQVDRDRVGDAIRRVGDGGSTQVEYRVTAGDGTTLWLESTAANRLDDPDVAAIITVSRDVTERHRTAQLLAHRAAHDALTGLLNRAELESRLASALAAAEGDGQPVSLAFIDIDMFKDLNDEYGHRTGDDVLRQVAHAIRVEVRGDDLVGRIGGDEMVIGMVGTDIDHAAAVVERIRARLQSIDFLPDDDPGERTGVTISIGLAQAEPGDDVAALLHRADTALYQSKRSGRDRLTVHRGGLTDAL
jgi:diguanylate cyclase (GGDEF)-like protein/PAS domain S-box-containing protein